MEEQGPTGVVTRSCTRMHAKSGTKMAGCKTPGSTLLTSPRMDSYYAPSRKTRRLSGRQSIDNLRQIRQKVIPGERPVPSGYLGLLPTEVSRLQDPAHNLVCCQQLPFIRLRSYSSLNDSSIFMQISLRFNYRLSLCSCWSKS